MIYAVGDIHGKRAMLARVLEYLRANLDEADRAVFLGDYIDRGEDSRGVIEDLIAFRADYPETVFLMGNHERMMLDVYEEDNLELWLSNGGGATLKSYGTFLTPLTDAWLDFIPAAHLDFLEATLLEWKEDGYHFVHAGLVPPGETWGFQSAVLECPDPRLWMREPFLSSEANFGAFVVFGHTPQRSGLPLLMPNKLGIDTAACFGGRLTVAALGPISDKKEGHLAFFQVGQMGDYPVSSLEEAA